MDQRQLDQRKTGKIVISVQFNHESIIKLESQLQATSFTIFRQDIKLSNKVEIHRKRLFCIVEEKQCYNLKCVMIHEILIHEEML